MIAAFELGRSLLELVAVTILAGVGGTAALGCG